MTTEHSACVHTYSHDPQLLNNTSFPNPKGKPWFSMTSYMAVTENVTDICHVMFTTLEHFDGKLEDIFFNRETQGKIQKKKTFKVGLWELFTPFI